MFLLIVVVKFCELISIIAVIKKKNAIAYFYQFEHQHYASDFIFVSNFEALLIYYHYQGLF